MVKITKKVYQSKKKSLYLAELISSKQAKNVVVLDMSETSGICDYFVICSGLSGVQVKAIRDEVIRTCKKDNINIQHCSSDESLRWVLLDFFDVILHIFLEEAREFYNLEYLWNSAKKINLVKKKVKRKAKQAD